MCNMSIAKLVHSTICSPGCAIMLPNISEHVRQQSRRKRPPPNNNLKAVPSVWLILQRPGRRRRLGHFKIYMSDFRLYGFATLEETYCIILYTVNVSITLSPTNSYDLDPDPGDPPPRWTNPIINQAKGAATFIAKFLTRLTGVYGGCR